MSFDLESFLPSSGGQINCDSAPWGDRTHNCVPRSFSWAMAMLGYPGVDPEAYTVAEYPGGNSGGESFQSAIAFIRSRPDLYPNPPAFTIAPFDFDVAEQAGQAGKPLVISGAVDCPGVRFSPDGQCGHASVLAAHVDPDVFVIKNAWQGDVQNYSRAGLAGSLDSICVVERACGSGAVQAATAAYSPGGTEGMAIIARPVEVGAYDLLVVGFDKQLWHNYGTLADMETGARWHSWGGGIVPGTVSASWTPDQSLLVISAQGPLGDVFVKEINRDGTVKTDWTRINGGGDVPVEFPLPGTPGPKGEPGKDGAPGAPGAPGAAADPAAVAAHLSATVTVNAH